MKKQNGKRVLSGMMAALTMLTAMISPMTAYAAQVEEPQEKVIPLYEEVKDQIADDEVVKVKDLEISFGTDFDVENDRKDLEYDKEKVKVTFHESKNEAGESFSTQKADSYKTSYYVEPVSGNPTYQVSRNIRVVEPVQEQTEEQAEAKTTGSGDAKEQSETAEEEAAPESETETSVTEESMTEDSITDEATEETLPDITGETNVVEESDIIQDETALDKEIEASQTQDTLDEKSGLDLPEVLEQAGENEIDLLDIEAGDSIEFEAIATYAASGRATQTVSVTRGEWYYYSDYGLGSYLTSPFYVSYGDITATAYCVQPSKTSPGSGTYTITKLGDGKNLAKVCYYGTQAAGEDGFFDEKHPDFSAGKRFVITHIAASYANGSSDAFEGTNDTGIALAKELYNYCVAMPDIPSVGMSFSESDVKAYIDGNSQRTKTIKFQADAAQTINMKLPKGVKLVNETTGKTSSTGANVELCGGTSFHLVAPLSQVKDVAQTFSSTMKGSITKDFSAYKISTGGATQDLAFVFGEGTVDEKYVDIKVTWMDLASVQVIKKDAETGNGVAGAIYGIYADKDCIRLIAQMPATNANGASVLQIEKTQETVYVKELAVPTGYLIDTAAYNVKLVSMTTTNQSVSQKEVKGSITVKKVDVETGKYESQGDATLQGAIYGLYAREAIVHPDGHIGNVYEAGALIGQKTFGKEDTIVFDNLYLGKYYVQEITAPEGYLIDEKKYDVDILYKDHATAKVDGGAVSQEQVKKQAFQIIKVSTDGSADETELVAGAEFTVKLISDVAANGWDDAKTYDVLTTDEKGYAKSIELPYGVYTVKETKTPEDMATIKDFTVTITKDSRDPQTWRAFNDAPFKAYIRMLKKDKQSGQMVLLSGVEFKIRNTDTGEFVVQKVGDKKIDTFITEENGMVTTPLQLEKGKYEVVEITAPSGYTILTESVPFVVTSFGAIQVDSDEDGDAVIDIVVENEAVTGAVNLYKHGEQLKGIKEDNLLEAAVNFVKELFTETEAKDLEFVYEDAALEKVTFHLIADETIYTPDWQKDEEGNRIIAQYEGVELTKGTVAACLTTDKEGKASVEGLPLGKYHLEETKTVDGFVINKTLDAFELTYENQDKAVIPYSSDFENVRVKTRVSVAKKCEVTETPVQGAVYGIYAAEDIMRKDGTVVLEKDTLIEQKTTDEKGELLFESDLPLGNYYVKEINPAPGYLLNETVYDAALVYQGQDVDVVSQAIETTDQPITLQVSKTDITTGEEIEGAHIQILDAEGEVFEEWDSTTEAHVIYGIPAGDYTMVETLAPTQNGYVKAENIPFTVKETGEMQQVEMKDDYTKVEISKTDITGENEVEGAKLAILDENDQVVESWTSTTKPHYVEKMPVGKYTLHEEAAPKGYVVINDVPFEITETAEIQKVAMKNDTAKGKVIIDKKDADNEEPLKGVEFELQDADGKVLETLKTDQAGHAESGLYDIASFKNGVYGDPLKYYLVETKALDGYELDDTKHEVVFEYADDHTPVIEVKFELTNKEKETPKTDTPTGGSTPGNSSSGGNTPKTGDDTNLVIPIILLLASLAGAGILIGRKVRRKKTTK